jgi:hypothetical protein
VTTLRTKPYRLRSITGLFMWEHLRITGWFSVWIARGSQHHGSSRSMHTAISLTPGLVPCWPSGTQLFVGGALGPNVYPVAHVDISHPFDSINQYFPPLELQSAPQLSAASRGKLQVLTKPLSSQNLARPQSHHAIVNPENPKSFRR